MWPLHAMECHTVSQGWKHLTCATAWRNLEDTVLSEMSQTQMDKYCAIQFGKMQKLWVGGGDGHRTGMYLMLLNWTLTLARMVILCEVYFTTMKKSVGVCSPHSAERAIKKKEFCLQEKGLPESQAQLHTGKGCSFHLLLQGCLNPQESREGLRFTPAKAASLKCPPTALSATPRP